MYNLSKKLNLGVGLLILFHLQIGWGQVDLKATPVEIQGLIQESTGVRFVKKDSKGQLYTTLRDKGLYQSNISKLAIQHIEHPEIKNGNIPSVFQTQNQKVWVWDNINRYEVFNPVEEGQLVFDLSKQLGDRRIFNIIQAQNGTFWISASDPGEAFETGKFYKYSNGMLTDLTNQIETTSRIQDIGIDKFGRVWLGKYEGAFGNKFFIEIYDPKSKQSEIKKFEAPDGVLKNFFYRIFKDRLGNMWLGTSAGLYAYDYQNDSFKNYNSTNTPGQLISNFVFNIYQTKDNRIWLGTEDGLAYFDPYSGKELEFKYFTEENGLPDNFVRGLIEDENNNLWIGTLNGLACLDLKDHSFRTYSKEDGFLSNIFTHDFKYDEKNNLLFLRSRNGLNIFHPNSLRKNTYIPPVQFTHFEYFYNDGQNTQSHEIKGIAYKEQVTLKHGQNNFSCRFAALSYRNPAKNQYAYQLVDVNDDWIPLGNKHSKKNFIICTKSTKTFYTIPLSSQPIFFIHSAMICMASSLKVSSI